MAQSEKYSSQMQLSGTLGSHINMRLLQLLLAGVLTVTALIAGVFVASLIVFPKLAGYFGRLASGKRAGGPETHSKPASRLRPEPTDEVIDVVATKVSTEPVER